MYNLNVLKLKIELSDLHILTKYRNHHLQLLKVAYLLYTLSIKIKFKECILISNVFFSKYGLTIFTDSRNCPK